MIHKLLHGLFNQEGIKLITKLSNSKQWQMMTHINQPIITALYVNTRTKKIYTMRSRDGLFWVVWYKDFERLRGESSDNIGWEGGGVFRGNESAACRIAEDGSSIGARFRNKCEWINN